MKPTFFVYIKRFVDYDADDKISRLANAIVNDIAFPKQSKDFDEISTYLEHSGQYGKLLTTFDDAWIDYSNL